MFELLFLNPNTKRYVLLETSEHPITPDKRFYTGELDNPVETYMVMNKQTLEKKYYTMEKKIMLKEIIR